MKSCQWGVLTVVIWALAGEGAYAAPSKKGPSLNQTHRRALFSGRSCARLAELDDGAMRALVNFAASGEEWS